jgi:hypothetical protein
MNTGNVSHSRPLYVHWQGGLGNQCWRMLGKRMRESQCGLLRRRYYSFRYKNGHHNCYQTSKITNSRELSPSSEAASCEATQNLRSTLWVRRFISELTRAPHRSVSWVRSIQSIQPNAIAPRSILILTIHLRLDLPSGLSKINTENTKPGFRHHPELVSSNAYPHNLFL